LWNESKEVWGIMDRKNMDEQDKTKAHVRSRRARSEEKLKAAARARSEDRTAGRKNSDLNDWDKKAEKIAETFRESFRIERPWAEYADSRVASDSSSVVRTRLAESFREQSLADAELIAKTKRGSMITRSHHPNASTALAALRELTPPPRRLSEAPSDVASAVQSGTGLRRSQSARGSLQRDLTPPPQRSEQASRAPRMDELMDLARDVAPSDSISQVSQRSRGSRASAWQDGTMRRSQSARIQIQSEPSQSSTVPVSRVEPPWHTDIAPSDSISQVSVPQRGSQEGMRRSRSAREISVQTDISRSSKGRQRRDATPPPAPPPRSQARGDGGSRTSCASSRSSAAWRRSQRN
jgi:hypothetical protein